jgi:transcription elongation factor Elf1
MFVSAGWLEKKYIDLVSSQLDKFKWIKDSVARFRCPLCGDSQRNPHKTRGYLYQREDRYYIKCHNCNASMSFQTLLKDLNPALYKSFVFELLKEKNYSPSFNPAPLPRPVVVERPSFDLPSLKTFDPNHVAVQYVARRKIPEAAWGRLWYTDKWGSWLKSMGWIDPTEKELKKLNDGPRLVIPFFDRQHRLTTAQGRALFPASSDSRYLTAKADDDVLKVFGLDAWDSNQPTWVCEGPLDALFMPNCLASAGADLVSVADQLADLGLLNISKTTLIFDNESRNTAIVRQMEKAIDRGYALVIWPNSVECKDINELALQSTDYLAILSHSVHAGLMAQMQLSGWRRDATDAYQRGRGRQAPFFTR